MAAKTPRTDVRLNKKFGELLRKKRDEKGLTQGELAAVAGIARTTIVKVESGEEGVRLFLLYRLAEALNIKPSDLLPDMANVRPVASEERIKQDIGGATGAILLRELHKGRKNT